MKPSTVDSLVEIGLQVVVIIILGAAVLGIRSLFLYISSLQQRIEVLEQKK